MGKETDVHDYTDILYLPHPISKKHPPMDRVTRAAQFAPFAALTGHKEAVLESERIVDRKIILDEHQKVFLDEALRQIAQCIKQLPNIYLTYFVPDERKQGGSYRKIYTQIKEIDEVNHAIILIDRKRILIADILEIGLLEEDA